MSKPEKLRIGVLLDSFDIPAWRYMLLEKISSSDVGILVAAICGGDEKFGNESREKTCLPLQLMERIDSRRNRIKPDACSVTNSLSLFESATVLHNSILHRNCEDPRENECFEPLKSLNLDVLLNLSEVRATRWIRSSARYGVWFFDLPCKLIDDPFDRSVGLFATLRRDPYLSAELKLHDSDNDKEVVLYSTVSSVRRFSFLKTRNEHLNKLISTIPRVLKRLHTGGESKLEESLPDLDILSEEVEHRSQIRTPELYWFGVLYGLWRTRIKIRRWFLADTWILLFKFGGNSDRFGSYTKIIPPSGRFWADPHVINRDGSNYVFFEDACVSTGKGHISVLQLNEQGPVAKPKTVIKKSYHLSYPFVFEWENELYMIPESLENKAVPAYICTQFPDQWKFCCNLIEGILAADATLVEDNGMWWMFANVQENEGASTWDELYLFYSDHPLSQNWKPHPSNPIVSDVRYARPAGSIYREGGFLFRPSQNSSRKYGFGLNVSRIIRLSTDEYVEEIVKTFRPDDENLLHGMHSFSKCGNLAVIDGIHRARIRK